MILSIQWLERKDSASQLFLLEYLDFTKKETVHTDIKVPHKIKNAQYFELSSWKERQCTTFLKDMTKSRLTINPSCPKWR